MHAQKGMIGAKGVKPIIRNETLEGEGGIKGKRRVTLGKNETIAVRIGGAGNPEHILVQAAKNIRDRERATYVSDMSPLRLLKDDSPNILALALNRATLAANGIIFNKFHTRAHAVIPMH
jgi:hypothetical protein